MRSTPGPSRAASHRTGPARARRAPPRGHRPPGEAAAARRAPPRHARRSTLAGARCPSCPTGPTRATRMPRPTVASSSGTHGVASSIVYSIGAAGIASTQARTPARNRSCMRRERSSHAAAMRAPARWNPTVRASRSSSSVRSPNSSDRRPVAARRVSSIWNSRSPAVTTPCANHRSSSELASMYGTPHASRRTVTGSRSPREHDLALGGEQRRRGHRPESCGGVGRVGHARSSWSWVLPSQLSNNPA